LARTVNACGPAQRSRSGDFPDYQGGVPAQSNHGPFISILNEATFLEPIDAI
jgi:hypothetical protein